MAAQGVQHISQISRCQGTCLANGYAVGELVGADAVTQRIFKAEQIGFQSAEQRQSVRLGGDRVVLAGGNVDKPKAVVKRRIELFENQVRVPASPSAQPPLPGVSLFGRHFVIAVQQRDRIAPAPGAHRDAGLH